MTPPGCHSVKVISITIGKSLVGLVTDPYRHLTYDTRGAWHTVYAMHCMPCSCRIKSEMLPEFNSLLDACQCFKGGGGCGGGGGTTAEHGQTIAKSDYFFPEDKRLSKTL